MFKFQITLFNLVYFLSICGNATLIPFGFFNQKTAPDPCGSTPTIGSPCTGGGIYAGVFDGENYMVTPGNCNDSSTPTCDGSTDSLNKRWRGTSGGNSDIPGVENIASSSATSSSSFKGEINTAAIIADSSVTADSAADYCANMNFGGYTDWYLPNKSELAHIYCYASVSGGSHNSSYPQENVNCTSQGGKVSLIAGFSASYYHSSTEIAASGYWAQNFSNGFQDTPPKSFNTRVRCVRKY